MRMFRLALSGSLFLLCCSHEARVDPAQTPPPDAWLQVALEVTGPAADRDKYERCVKTGYELGVAVSPQAPVKAVLYLQDGGNRVIISPMNGGVAGAPVRDEARPGWPMPALCADAFATAADWAGHPVQISRSEPGPECAMRGLIEGESRGGWFAVPSYDAALGAMKLRAARAGMNLLVVDAVRQLGAQVLTLNGRGFTCQGGVVGGIVGGEAPPPAAGPACVPDCSPGYTCVGGKCISACNPPCAAKQHCGEDRLCH